MESGTSASVAVQLENLKGRVGRMEFTVSEHTQSIREFGSFVTGFKATEEEREKQQEKRHEENSEKLQSISNKLTHRSLIWTVAGVMVAVAALCATILAIVVTVKLSGRGDIDPTKLIHPQAHHEPMLSLGHKPPQDAQVYVRR